MKAILKLKKKNQTIKQTKMKIARRQNRIRKKASCKCNRERPLIIIYQKILSRTKLFLFFFHLASIMYSSSCTLILHAFLSTNFCLKTTFERHTLTAGVLFVCSIDRWPLQNKHKTLDDKM